MSRLQVRTGTTRSVTDRLGHPGRQACALCANALQTFGGLRLMAGIGAIKYRGRNLLLHLSHNSHSKDYFTADAIDPDITHQRKTYAAMLYGRASLFEFIYTVLRETQGVTLFVPATFLTISCKIVCIIRWGCIIISPPLHILCVTSLFP